MAHIAQVCRLVEGMPLAILLAAAWVGMLSLSEIAAQIAGESEAGIDFLTADWRDMPERQRSMRAVFDRSWGLLSERERQALARQAVREALQIGDRTRGFFPCIFAMPALALLLADAGEGEQATELYALASRYPFVAHSRWFEDVAGRHISAEAAALPPDVVAAAQERGRARDLQATVKELLEELARQGEPVS
jgi:hypothetical protein